MVSLTTPIRSVILIKPSFEGSTFCVIEQPSSTSEKSHSLSVSVLEIISSQLKRFGSFLVFESQAIAFGVNLLEASRKQLALSQPGWKWLICESFDQTT